MNVARTYLYVPADHESVMRKAGSRGADALILDLEDGVAMSAKAGAREILSRVLTDGIEGADDVWVRINPPSVERGALARDDLEAAVSPRLSGIVVAKTESAETLAFVRDTVHELAAAQGLDDSMIGLSPIIESALGLENLREIARFPGVVRLKAGEVDLVAALGLEPSPDEIELLPMRSAIVTASAAAGILPPAGSVFRDRDDPDGLRVSTLRLRRLGFVGRSVIHPAQIPVVNEVFTPNAAELDEAQRIAQRYEEEVGAGNGAYLDEEGRMVDIAVVRRAWRTLSLVRD